MRKAATGFVPQPNEWQCGPYALKHALLALGVIADEETVTHVSGATEDGADEHDLARAAAHYGCALDVERFDSANRARAALTAALAARTPVLLCVDQWSHWIAVAAADDAGVVVLDSRLVGVFQILEWDVLLRRLACREGRGVLYDLHPVMVRSVAAAPALLSRTRVAFLLDPAQRELGHRWGYYLSRLLPLHRPRMAQLEWTTSLAEALRDHAMAFLAGAPDRTRLRAHRRLTHAAFVADTHGLRLAVDGRPQVGVVARELQEPAAAA